MTTATKKFILTFTPTKARKNSLKSFYDLAKRHIIKGKKGDRNVSQNIDKILYEAYSLHN